MRNRARRVLKTVKEAFWLLCIWPVVILVSAFAPDDWGEILDVYND